MSSLLQYRELGQYGDADIINIRKRGIMRKTGRKGPSYLDVAEFILSGPFSPKLTPAAFPIEAELS